MPLEFYAMTRSQAVARIADRTATHTADSVVISNRSLNSISAVSDILRSKRTGVATLTVWGHVSDVTSSVTRPFN